MALPKGVQQDGVCWKYRGFGGKNSPTNLDLWLLPVDYVVPTRLGKWLGFDGSRAGPPVEGANQDGCRMWIQKVWP